MGSERIDQFTDFVNQLFERFKHDDGTSLPTKKHLTRNNLEDTYEKVVFEELNELISFKAESEVARFNPSRPEYWRPFLNVQPSLSGHTNARGQTKQAMPLGQYCQNEGLPPDPISDEDFYSLQKRICKPVDHCTLMNESLMRCEASDDGSNAESIPSDDDFEDFENEVKWYLPRDISEMKSQTEEDPCEPASDSSKIDEEDSKNRTVIYHPNFTADKPHLENQFHKLESTGPKSMDEPIARFDSVMNEETTQSNQTRGYLRDNNRPTSRRKYKSEGPVGDDAIVEFNKLSEPRRYSREVLATNAYYRFKPRLSSTLQLPEPMISVLPYENNGKPSYNTVPVAENKLCNENVPLTTAQRRLRQLNIVVPTITEEERLRRMTSLDSLAMDFLQVPRLLLKQAATERRKSAGMPAARRCRRA